MQDSINPERNETDNFTIILHRVPDLDCVVSSFLAIAWLTSGRFPESSAALARYVDKVDGGYLGLTQENPYSLYSAYMQINHRLSLRSWNSEADLWSECVRNAQLLINFVLEKMEKEERSIFEVDAFKCPGLFGPRDREDVEKDIDRYKQKI